MRRPGRRSNSGIASGAPYRSRRIRRPRASDMTNALLFGQCAGLRSEGMSITLPSVSNFSHDRGNVIRILRCARTPATPCDADRIRRAGRSCRCCRGTPPTSRRTIAPAPALRQARAVPTISPHPMPSHQAPIALHLRRAQQFIFCADSSSSPLAKRDTSPAWRNPKAFLEKPLVS